MPIYDFLCENNHLIESRQNYGVDTIECPVCHCKTKRLFTAQGQTFTGTPTGAYCSSTSIPRDEKRYDVTLFQEACAEREYAHSKTEEVAQRPLLSDNLWGVAKKRADRILKEKEPPVTSQTRFKSRSV